MKKALDSDPQDIAGPHWWLNRGVPELGKPIPYPAAPADMFMQLGHWGQRVFIIPSLDMVVVRVGDDRNYEFDSNRFLELALDLAKDVP